MSDSNPASLFSSLRRLGDLAVTTVHNRVELFAVELQEEKCRLIQAILLTAAAIALGVTALTLITITIVVVFWDEARVAALCALSTLFVIATIVVGWFLNKLLAGGPGFSGTLRELEKDHACFQPRE